MKLVYIANARLPTEKAHGLQIVRMCEAFSSLGLDVVLLHPRRVQINHLLKHQAIFDYYNVRTLFTVKTLPNFDVLRLERFVPQPFFAGLFSLHAFLWGGLAVRYAAKERGDFYFTRDPAVAWWLGREGLPTILEVHTLYKRLQGTLLRAATRRSSVFLVVSMTEHLRRNLIETSGVPQNKTLALHDGVDLERFCNPVDRAEARQRLGLPLEQPLVVYTGQLFPEKGVDTLIRAASLLSGVEFLIVGGMPNEMKMMRRLVEETRATNANLVGHVLPERVPLYLRAADVLVLPNSARYAHSVYYTSPLKLFEYMASRRPIVTSNLPSICEVIKDKHTAIVVKPDSPESLANGIQTLLAHPELGEKLSDNAFRDVQRYTWRKRVEKIVKLFEKNVGNEKIL